MPYTVGRAGRELVVDVPIYRFSAPQLAHTIAWHYARNPTALLQLLIMSVVFLLRPRNIAARLMFLYSACYFASVGVTTTIAGTSVVGLPELLYRGAYWPAVFFTNMLWAILTIPLIAHLALVFPVIKAPLRKTRRWSLPVLYGLAPCLVPFYFVAESDGSRALVIRLVVSLTLSLLLVVVASAIHTLVTVRDSVAQAQGRWLAVGLLATVNSSLVSALLLVVWGDQQQNLLLYLTNLLALGFPLALGIAILRYRLFDITIVINRTLVYGLLSAMLALIYFSGVVTLQQLFRVVAGQESDLAIVGSTLTIAALFQPLRRGLQGFIDRRFYRRKYDTTQTLQAFGTTLRDEVDLEQLATNLLAVVDDTMQPERLSLWLRTSPAKLESELPGNIN